MKKITEGKVVVAPDSHQNLKFLNTIIENEEPFDHLVNLSDHFDTFEPIDNVIHFSVGNVCEWINEKLKDDRFIWLASNHDCSYLASYTKDYTKTKPNPYYNCSGWTRNKAKSINKNINPEYWNKMELCVQLGDSVIVSHAGFHYYMFKPYMSELDNIKHLYDEWERDKHTFKYEPWHWIWDVGRCRGGTALVGGVLWLDWDQEFVPLDHIRQILGHSTDPNGARCKKNGIGLENWCIDGMQTCYATWENGKLEIKYINQNPL